MYLRPEGIKLNSLARICSGWTKIFLAFWATCFSHREPKSLCLTPIILEQTFTMPFKLFLSFRVRPLYQQMNEKVIRLSMNDK